MEEEASQQVLIPKAGDADTIRYQLDTSKFKKELIENLTGLRYDKREKKFIEIGYPTLNLWGAQKLVSVIMSFINNKEVALSNLPPSIVRDTIKDIAENAADLIFRRGFRQKASLNKNDMTTALLTVENTAQTSLFKAENGLSFKMINSNITKTEQTINKNNESQGTSFTDAFKFFKGGESS